MKSTLDMLPIAARNLLVNCAELNEGDRLLVVVEEDTLQHYSPSLGPTVALAARGMGIEASLFTVPFHEVIYGIDPALENAMGIADCTIFFARLGDQLRFCGLGDSRKVIVCYALDEDMLNSSFGSAHHDAFKSLKSKIDRAFGLAHHVHVTCPNGTDFEGPGHASLLAEETEVAVTRFPLSVFAPVPAAGFSGQIAQKGFLTGTCSRFYSPYSVDLDGVLIVEFEDNKITGFSGSDTDVAIAKRHYNAVSGQFGLDSAFIHSWHVGIHPGCAYTQSASSNFERWGTGAFGNPRILHFHTCGNYAPGEISLNVFDPTVVIDGVRLWENGRLYPERMEGGGDVLNSYPCAKYAFENPAMAIGV